MRLWRGGDSAEANARAFLCVLAVIVRPAGLWCQCADMQAVGNTCRFALRNEPFWGAVCAVLECRMCRLAVRCRRGELGRGVPLPFGGLCLGLMLAGNGRRRALLAPAIMQIRGCLGGSPAFSVVAGGHLFLVTVCIALPVLSSMYMLSCFFVADITENPSTPAQNTVPVVGSTLRAREPDVLTT